MENQYDQYADEIEIDLMEIIRVLAAKIPVMVAAGLLGAMLAFLAARFLMTPVYASTTKIYILNKQENSSVTYSDIQIGTQLTKDYAELILGRSVLEKVIKQLGLDMDYGTLKKKVTVDAIADTRIISITVRDPDPARAMETANAVRDIAAVHITNVMDIEAVNVAETAYLPTEKSSPNVKKVVLLGGFFGIFLVAAVAVIRYLLNDTIKTSEDVEKYLGLSTLALIPVNESGKKGKKSRWRRGEKNRRRNRKEEKKVQGRKEQAPEQPGRESGAEGNGQVPEQPARESVAEGNGQAPEQPARESGAEGNVQEVQKEGKHERQEEAGR